MNIDDKVPLCKCGCGQPTKQNRSGSYNHFIVGHNPKRQGTAKPSNNVNTGRFQPGNTHGKGRPAGSRNKITLAAANILEEQAAAISERAVDMALDDDRAMIKMILERVVPVKKSEHILDILKITGWRIRGTNGAAEILALKPTTLESRMAKLEIRRPLKNGT